MQTVNVEYARWQLTRAFVGVPRRNSTADVTNVAEDRRSVAFQSRPTRIEQFDDHAVCVPVEAVHAAKGRRYQGSRHPLPPTAFADASWRRASRETGPVMSAWLHYCYGDELAWPEQVRLCQFVWTTFLQDVERDGVSLHDDVRARVKTLVWLSVQYEKALIHQREFLSASALAQLLHVDRSTFSRIYNQHWYRLEGICAALDEEALNCANRRQRSGEQV
ncbi:hypothetical protein ETB55_21945 [Salmonella enterica subsp. enterica serovar Omuna]|nr:hypothetical protein [Salmonella enterica subsp. enterica serovar Omuna]